MKKITKYALGLVGITLSAIGVTNAKADTVEADATPSIQKVTEDTPLYLSSAISVQQDATFHYSHMSHGSHRSHSSHRSHFSHRSGY